MALEAKGVAIRDIGRTLRIFSSPLDVADSAADDEWQHNRCPNERAPAAGAASIPLLGRRPSQPFAQLGRRDSGGPHPIPERALIGPDHGTAPSVAIHADRKVLV